MNEILVTTIGIPELVEKIASAIEERISGSVPPATQNAVTDVRLYGDRAAADHIGCTVQTVIALRKRGEIPFYKYGRKYFYKSSEIDAALKVDARRFGELRGRGRNQRNS